MGKTFNEHDAKELLIELIRAKEINLPSPIDQHIRFTSDEDIKKAAKAQALFLREIFAALTQE